MGAKNIGVRDLQREEGLSQETQSFLRRLLEALIVTFLIKSKRI